MRWNVNISFEKNVGDGWKFNDYHWYLLKYVWTYVDIFLKNKKTMLFGVKKKFLGKKVENVLWSFFIEKLTNKYMFLKIICHEMFFS